MTVQKYWTLGSYRVSNWQLEYMGFEIYKRNVNQTQNFGIQF